MNIAFAVIPPVWSVCVALLILVVSAAITGKIIKF
jgi:hypothetical protein